MNNDACTCGRFGNDPTCLVHGGYRAVPGSLDELHVKVDRLTTAVDYLTKLLTHHDDPFNNPYPRKETP